MKIDVDFFGLAIYKRDLGPKYRTSYYLDRSRGYGWNNQWKARKKKIADHHYEWKCYFVIDVGRASKQPIVFWSMEYRNEEIIKKVLEASTNAGSALLLSKSKDKQARAVENIVKLKMAYFGIEDVPIKWLSAEEWHTRYKRAPKQKNNKLAI